MKKIFCLLLCAQLIFVNAAFAEDEDLVKNTQNDILLVAAAGAGGAVLGLSTLSFYDKPSKHISNVWTGAAIGIIAGVIFVAYNSAQRGSEDLVSKVPASGFSTEERGDWHASNNTFLTSGPVQFSTDFFSLTF